MTLSPSVRPRSAAAPAALALGQRPGLLLAGFLAGSTWLSAAIGWRCPFHELTGWDCPACGGTRALRALLHGDVVAALRNNAVAIVVGLLAVLAAATRSRTFGGRTTRALQLLDRPAVVLGGLLAWTLLRNLPSFSWLRPVGDLS